MKGPRVVNAPRPRAHRRSVYGYHPVREYVSRRPASVETVYLAHQRDAKMRQLAREAAAAGIAVSHADREGLEKLCGSPHHQGVVASLREFDYASLEEVVRRQPKMLVAADGIEDPRNLGALIRGVAAAGAGAVIIPRDRASPMTEVVEKAAAGVTAWLPICRVVNLGRALLSLKEGGFWVVGLSQKGAADLFQLDLPPPLALVVGGESGLRPGVAKMCHVEARIPMQEGVESLNVAVAAAVAAFELRRRHIDSLDGG